MGRRRPVPGAPFELGDVVGAEAGQEFVPTKRIAIAALDEKWLLNSYDEQRNADLMLVEGLR